jgi:hypothetical protein
LNTLFYRSALFDDLFVLKNGLRFIGDSSNPHYLLQTIHYQWNLSRPLNQFNQWQSLMRTLRNNIPGKFFWKTFQLPSTWWSSEVFGTYAIMEQLEPEKSLRVCVKVVLIAVFLLLFTGTLGLFVTVTILFNFISTMAILTLFNFELTVENMAHFTVVLIICSQYSVLYSMR